MCWVYTSAVGVQGNCGQFRCFREPCWDGKCTAPQLTKTWWGMLHGEITEGNLLVNL